MSYWWRSWDTPEQIREYEEQDEWMKEFLSHPENVEKMRVAEENYRKMRVGEEFYNSHTKDEVDIELNRLADEFRDLIANTDITSLYTRPYPTQGMIQ